MLSAEYIQKIADGAALISNELHTIIIAKIVRRIIARFERGEEYILTPTDKWQIETLQESGLLLEELQAEIARLTPYQLSEIKRAFEEAAIESIKYDDEVYTAAGLLPTPLKKSPYLIRLLQRDYEATIATWQNLTGTFAEASQQLFIKQCDTAHTLVASGAMSYTEAYKNAVETIVKDGVKITYPSGHTDTIETATLRCVRTGVSQSTAAITNARMDEMDWDIVLVSSHLGARVTGKQDYTDHAWWQGKFYSRSGKSSKFPPFSICGQGDVQGINGANCGHSYGPGDGINNPFEQYDSDENRRVYELSQRQRALERRIRSTKREVMGFKDAAEKASTPEIKAEFEKKYQQKATLLQQQNKRYNAFCESTGRKRQNDRLIVAGWDRKQATAATGAARKYNATIQKNRGIIKERIATGKYSLKLSEQQYLKHVAGTTQYEQYAASRRAPQGRLTVTKEEAQSIINRFAGTGDPKISLSGEVLQIEFISCDKTIGQYYSNGEWHDTRRAAIHYGQRNAHIVPVEEKK